MTCQACGQSNFNWKRTCAGCGGSLGTPPESKPTEAERELQLSRPEPVDYAAEDARAVSAAFAHTPAPFVTPLLIAANVIMFFVVLLKGGAVMAPAPELLRGLGATYGPAVTSGEWWRLGAAVFLHAGLVHLAFNMAALLTIGGLTERMFGHASFLMLYLVSGLAGSIASVYFHPFAVGVGASGAVFGLYGALFAYLALQRASLPPDVARSLRNGGVAFVGYALLFGVTHAGVGTAAHVGGFFAGAAVGAGLASTIASPSFGRQRATRVIVWALGSAAVALLALRLPATDDWPEALRSLAALEALSPNDIERAGGRVADGTMPPAQIATVIDGQVLGPWREHRQHIASMTRLPAREREAARQTLAYMDHRIAAWQLQADAFRRDDMTLIEKSVAEHAAANAVARDVLKLFGAPRPVSRRNASAPRAEDGAREFERALEVAQQLDRTATLLYNNAVQRSNNRILTDAEFATLIERDILKSWDAHWRRISELRGSGRVETARQRLQDYMRLSSEAWHLTATGLQTHSPKLIEEAEAVRRRAVAAGSLIMWVRSSSPEEPLPRVAS